MQANFLSGAQGNSNAAPTLQAKVAMLASTRDSVQASKVAPSLPKRFSRVILTLQDFCLTHIGA